MLINRGKFELLLAEKELSAAQLFKSVNMTCQIGAKIKRGENLAPRTVGKIAKAFGVKPMDLLGNG